MEEFRDIFSRFEKCTLLVKIVEKEKSEVFY